MLKDFELIQIHRYVSHGVFSDLHFQWCFCSCSALSPLLEASVWTFSSSDEYWLSTGKTPLHLLFEIWWLKFGSFNCGACCIFLQKDKTVFCLLRAPSSLVTAAFARSEQGLLLPQHRDWGCKFICDLPMCFRSTWLFCCWKLLRIRPAGITGKFLWVTCM